MQKTEFPKEPWNKKRIAGAIVIVGLLLFVAGYFLRPSLLDTKRSASSSDSPNSVKGTSTKNADSSSVSLPTASDLAKEAQQNFNNIRNEITKLNVSDIASSSPQVQKIINDIKTLPNYPKDQAKDICQKICSGI